MTRHAGRRPMRCRAGRHHDACNGCACRCHDPQQPLPIEHDLQHELAHDPKPPLPIEPTMTSHELASTTRPATGAEAADAIRRSRAARAEIGEPVDPARVETETVEVVELVRLVEDVRGRGNHVEQTVHPRVCRKLRHDPNREEGQAHE